MKELSFYLAVLIITAGLCTSIGGCSSKKEETRFDESTSAQSEQAAHGLTPEQAQNSVRFSLGRGNTEAEIDDVVEIMVEIVSRLRNL